MTNSQMMQLLEQITELNGLVMGMKAENTQLRDEVSFLRIIVQKQCEAGMGGSNIVKTWEFPRK